MAIDHRCISYAHINNIEVSSHDPQWLIRSLWLSEAVGAICAAPKSCKSWLGLDIAVSIASATPCLGQFEVEQPGRVLIYLAEDSLKNTRMRIDGICRHRRIATEMLDLYTVTEPLLLLDDQGTQNGFEEMIANLKPRFVLLDPLIRLHRLDENDSSHMSQFLAYFRTLQRKHQCSLAFIHHATKRSHANPGLNLRGSTDLYAFGDSNIFLKRRETSINLIIEHRSAPSVSDLSINLVSDGDYAHLAICDHCVKDQALSVDDMKDRIVKRLKASSRPITRTDLRDMLKIKNETLGALLRQLQDANIIIKSNQGIQLRNND